jgi:thymidylate synthase
MNNLDKQYQALLQDILDNGVRKEDRTGTGTLSVFGRQIRHKMSEGFPLLTTKKMFWKGIVTELLWFLRGDTNIKYLVDNDCHIWDGDAYKNYLKWFNEQSKVFVEQGIVREPWTKEQYIEQIKLGNVDSDLSELGPIYGKQWRNWESIKPNYPGEYEDPSDGPCHWSGYDQIGGLIYNLKTNPDSRRLMVSAWNVGELDQMVLPPCHYGFQVYTRELSLEERKDWWNKGVERGSIIYDEIYDKDEYSFIMDKEELDKFQIPTRAISLIWNQRSVDTFLGLPFNIASYGLLLEIIAKAVNMVPDELIGNLGDTHLYLNHVEQAKEQIGRQPYSLPRFNINTEWWPTESGECGVGPIDALAVVNGFANDNFCKCLMEQDFQLGGYQSHPTIKAPLSN